MREALRVRLDISTALRLVLAAALTVAVLVGLDRSRHLLAWVLTAAAVALVLDGPVRALTRFLPRGWSIAAVTVSTLLALGGAGYAIADALVEEYSRLQGATPGAAQRLAERIGLEQPDAQRFVERVEQIVDDGPRRLVGSPRDVTEGTLSRLAIFAIVLTLAVFLLAAGTRALHRVGVVLARTPTRATPLEISVGLLRGAQSARHRLAHVTLLGLAVAAAGNLVDLPGSTPLALWAGLWRLLPLLGLLIAYAPVVSLLLLTVPQDQALGAVGALLLVECLLSWVTHRRRKVEYAPLRIVSALALLAGFEMYGAVGALVAFVLAHTLAGAGSALLAHDESAAHC